MNHIQLQFMFAWLTSRASHGTPVDCKGGARSICSCARLGLGVDFSHLHSALLMADAGREGLSCERGT